MSRVPVQVAGEPGEAPAGWEVLRPSACPCCVGRVQLQVDLVKLIREQRPPGVRIEIPEAAHRHALRRTLCEWPFSDYLVVMPD